MKNKKLLKTLVATMVCSAMSITAFAFSACDAGNNDGDNGDDKDTTVPHEHTYSEEWSSNGRKHWHRATCDHVDLIVDEDEHTFDSNGVCTVCHNTEQIIYPTKTEADDKAPEFDEDGKLLVNYEYYPDDTGAQTLKADLVSGIFTLGNGTILRGRHRDALYDPDGNKIKDIPTDELNTSIQMNSASSLVKIKAPAEGKLTLWIQNGSSGGLTTQKLRLTKPNGSGEDIVYRAEGSLMQLVELDFTEAGVYKITREEGTSDIFYMSYVAKVEDSPVESIVVGATGTVDYFVGQSFGIEGLSVNAVHKDTGRVSPVDVERLKVDYVDYDNTKSGTYAVNISYVKDGQTFETSYNVNVYSFDDIKLGIDKIIKGSNTSANNGTYINHTLRQLYFKGEAVSYDGLSVILNGKNGGKSGSFLLGNRQYTISQVDTTTAGKKTITISVTTNGVTKQGTFDIYVVEKDADLATATSVNTVVDANVADANVGVKNGEGAYQFKTIHQALEFLENSGVPASAKKTINLSAGTYWEKLEINVPNLTIEGAGRDTTTIEYDALYGVADDGGFEHVTDSTATLNVREKAENFTIKGVTISNYWNSQAVFDKDLGSGYPEHRALAVLIQADKVTVDNCKMLGYQDTVEFFTGRQYIVNTYISGTTDFIFGTNNTTYFENCQIHSISSGKTDGGYITAFKGCNKGAEDVITYGAIFDKCRFTADSDVVENKNTAIGRPWGAYANVAVINSEIDGHVSTQGFVGNGNSKNLRYVSMSVKPTADTVKFVEYNNTGAGAIDTAVGGMSMLSADEAKNYSDFKTIFGTTNGKVKYSSVWMPVNPNAQTHTVTVTTKDGVELGTLTIEEGKAILFEQLEALVLENDTYKAYDIVGVYSDNECQTVYGYPEISADGNVYVELYFEKAIVSSTTINFKTGANYADLTESGKLEITPAEEGGNPYKEIKSDCIGFYKDTEISFEVKAGTTVIIGAYGSNYTNYTVKIDGVLKTDIEGATENTGVLTGDAEFTVDSNCTVTLVCGGSTAIADCNYLKTITINVPHTYALGEVINLMDYDGANLEKDHTETAKWNGIIIDTSKGGKFSKRTSDIQCGIGATLTFNVANGITEEDITVISYQGGPVVEGTWEITVENGVATIECIGTASNHQYISAIHIGEVA